MGQAKNRGTYEQRVAQAQARKAELLAQAQAKEDERVRALQAKGVDRVEAVRQVRGRGHTSPRRAALALALMAGLALGANPQKREGGG
jgi:hypothetical protein